MKKTFAVLAASAALIFSLTACGAAEPISQPAKPVSPAQQEAPEAQPAPEPEPVESEVSEPAPVESVSDIPNTGMFIYLFTDATGTAPTEAVIRSFYELVLAANEGYAQGLPVETIVLTALGDQEVDSPYGQGLVAAFTVWGDPGMIAELKAM